MRSGQTGRGLSARQPTDLASAFGRMVAGSLVGGSPWSRPGQIATWLAELVATEPDGDGACWLPAGLVATQPDRDGLAGYRPRSSRLSQTVTRLADHRPGWSRLSQMVTRLADHRPSPPRPTQTGTVLADHRPGWPRPTQTGTRPADHRPSPPRPRPDASKDYLMAAGLIATSAGSQRGSADGGPGRSRPQPGLSKAAGCGPGLPMVAVGPGGGGWTELGFGGFYAISVNVWVRSPFWSIALRRCPRHSSAAVG